MHNVGEVAHVSDNVKYGVVYETVVIAQGVVEIDKNHIVLSLNTVEKYKRLWKTIYKELDDN